MKIESLIAKVFLACAAAAVAWQGAIAQPYPDKPVRIVVPYPPGGGSDLIARMFAQRLGDKWGQPVVIENRSGASGAIGADYVAKSPADGYTLLMGSTAELALSVAIDSKLPYSPARDFTPVIALSNAPLLFVVPPTVQARGMKEFIALAKSRPGKLSYSTPGRGSAHHVAGEWLKLVTGADINHVPYKGGGQQLGDLVGGQVDSGFLPLSVAAPMLTAGKLRALAIISPRRSPNLPAVPTLEEAGIAGIDVSQWRGILAPKGTPAAIIARLNADFGEVLAISDIRTRMLDIGEEPIGGSAEQFATFMATEINKYRNIVSKTKLAAQ